ncbi:hypothetical protein, partial [Pseudomonas edaphica]|uniref:hypothetical protein n=1 Tax=Pseudomonas edaphica TaxID=2006980 RepID=UPI00197EFBFB
MPQSKVGQAADIHVERLMQRDHYIIGVQWLFGIACLEQRQKCRVRMLADSGDAIEVVFFVRRTVVILLKQLGLMKLILRGCQTQPDGQSLL